MLSFEVWAGPKNVCNSFFRLQPPVATRPLQIVGQGRAITFGNEFSLGEADRLEVKLPQVSHTSIIKTIHFLYTSSVFLKVSGSSAFSTLANEIIFLSLL